jgi:hypothetical protein
MVFVLWILAVVLVVSGIVSLLRGQVLRCSRRQQKRGRRPQSPSKR